MEILPYHPLADLFPLMSGQEFQELVTDVRENGLREPVITLGGAILDGRNRYRACIEAGEDVQTKEYEGTDPAAFVISLNLRRRHLSESQRAMVAAKIATLGRGRQWVNASIEAFTQDAAATLLNVSRSSIQRAAEVRDHAVPALTAAVEAGDVSVAAAAEVATLSREQQVQVVARGEREILAAARQIKAAKQEVKKEARSDKERALAVATIAASQALGTKVYGVIYADPPWRFEPYSRDTGMDRAADNHYPTVDTAGICAMRVPAADDAILFMWATVPMLQEGLDVLRAWGFTYKSHAVWVKDRIGTGYWFRNKHEVLLVGTRGNIPAPAMGDQAASALEAPCGKHSAKPEVFADLIVQMFPTLPRLEMFARDPKPDWDAWGNEAPSLAA
jgi:N6-adenosine-specific RNA methylase IME4/ParB-like chromosome segregation protein Spo0J